MSQIPETKPKPVMLTRDAILVGPKLKTEIVEVPEWGGAVRVREMTGLERDEFESGIVEAGGVENPGAIKGLRAKTVALTVIDDDGKRFFTDADVASLGQLSASALNRVFEVSSRLSGLEADAVEAAAGK